MSPHGLLVVDKPPGMTSHDVVARVRRLAGTRKVGHAGTLDPMATGVLLLGLGRATRLLGHLALAEKTYEATIRLGVVTTTDDAEGEVVSRSSTEALEESAARSALGDMVGEIDQVPSAVSAIKVGGRPSYERVRSGEQVELAARRVQVHALDVHDVRRVDEPEGPVHDLDVTVRCSSGTYVRAIARDLGSVLGVGGHLTRLRRTAVGSAESGVTLADAVTLDAAEEGGALPVLDLDHSARRFFPSVDLSEALAQDVRHGRALDLELPASGPHALFSPDGQFLALYEDRDGTARAVAVFV